LAIPGGNPKDACVIATWPQGSPGGGGGSKIQDADGDTSWDVEQSADEDKIHGKVKGVEAFLLSDKGILTLAKQSACAGYQSSNQTIPNLTYTKINFDTMEFDLQNEFDLANDRFTATEAGIYFAQVELQISLLDQGDFVIASIYVNGAQIKDIATQCVADGKSPVVNVATLRVTGLVGTIIGFWNTYTNFFTDLSLFWWNGVLHIPLFTISIYALILS